jgi:hypothetical protein
MLKLVPKWYRLHKVELNPLNFSYKINPLSKTSGQESRSLGVDEYIWREWKGFELQYKGAPLDTLEKSRTRSPQ